MSSVRKTALVALALVVAIAGLARLTSAADGVAEPTLPFAEPGYVLGDNIDDYASFMMSGGPPPDGIPSIDNPRFVAADAARLDPGDMVIGYAHGGQARAYPQRILVLHEIVNDRVGGLNVAITYCPLTATAQGFKRGGTTLGVSGQLLNSNLVLFDRETRSFFSQIAATGLTGQHRGRTLDEVNLIWTTWERWRTAHPDTEVLSERTGHLRNYNRDPYGSYNPLGGYYAQDRTMFPLMHSSGRHHQKEMVVGGRTSERSAYFVMSDLARDRILATASFLAVYDPDLDTGYIYVRDGQNLDIEPRGDGTYTVDGDVFAPDALPLDQVVSVEAFFFAWNAFYPDSESP
jgi:hypothetical protein